ncbi:MAG: hypothetical protein WCD50_05230 [Onishia taeanensis]
MVCLILPVLGSTAVAFEEEAPIFCAIRDVNDCGANYPCVEVSPESVALPDFFEVDLGNNMISSVGSANIATTPIERTERLNGKLILQGGDASGNNPRGGVGWTLSVDEESGKMVLSGVGDGFALVVFGSCLQT